MELHKLSRFASYAVIIDPNIHKRAKLSRVNFLDRVSHVKQIRLGYNPSKFTIYFKTFEEFNMIHKFYEFVNYGKFEFKHNYTFAIILPPNLYDWFRKTDYEVIVKQITFWFASRYFFQPEERNTFKEELYSPFFEKILKLVNQYYKDFDQTNFYLLDENSLSDEKDDTLLFELMDKCIEKYLESCKTYFGTTPPEIFKSPFGTLDSLNWGWGLSDDFYFFKAFFRDDDWKNVIEKGTEDDLVKSESNLEIWEKWKHTFANFDRTNDCTYSFDSSTRNSPKKEKISVKRETISKEVRNEVWKRDEGRCCICRSNEKLELDHIIPVSKGGSSTWRNVQLLCEKCNREKYNKI